ncbi:hypothetical protein Poli38472_004469 [Pythium oligandrum]|uniref:Uncharacterized protein n=1 Tax=Pythium oligandrum TaxID=41045 RepID=A0A8K1FDG6_PYTOL|nr:hypothetical protein Poli38472_004469 [Pythium oligandrum]|eukprot:TMW59400.1 hypothetical protein Poli38472_004469 [Pythium oligandrum]
MHQLARCSQLCELDVDFRHIGPEQAIAALQNLVKLRRLIVSGARIHDVLEALPSLQSLQCGRNTDWRSKTSSASSECKLLDIQPHSALRFIELEHTTWYRFLPYLVPNLQHIYIYIDDVIPSVSELLAWRHLVSLRLHVVDIDLPNGYVRRLLKGLPHLVTLNIVVGYFPWQDKLQVERPMLPKLTELVLRKCRCFTVEAILGLQGLTWLDITGWGKVEYLALLKRSNGLGRWVAEAY